MIILVLFGLGMCLLAMFMVVAPLRFANGILRFSEKPWFHPFEIASRLIVGVLFLFFAKHSAHSVVAYTLGFVLCFVSLLLLLIGADKHRAFARLTVSIGQRFRPLGVLAIACGLGLIYIGLKQ